MTHGEERRRGRARSKEPFKRRDVAMKPDKEYHCPIGRLQGTEKCVKNETCLFWMEDSGRCRLTVLVYNMVGFFARKGKKHGRAREADRT